MSVILVQVDGFSRITAENGQEVAGRVARVAVQLMKASMRDMDHISHLSDDTFALLLPGAKLHDTSIIAERIRVSVERCRLPRQAGIMPFTVSVGCVEAIDGDDMRRIMERARKALEAAIQQGRNCTFVQDGNATRLASDLVAAGR
jgi:diguanylate cyclase (GGDEF)-like protein